MRQAIRALGWAIIILWISTFLLPITVGFSLWKLLEPNAVAFREPIVSFSNGIFSLSAPFFINNTGFYDLTDLNVTILVGTNNETIATFSPPLPNVLAGTTLNSSYNISFSLEEITSKNIELLTEDTDLNLGISASFRVAHVITFGASTNMTTQWKAPLYNLTISEVSYNVSSQKLSMSVGFENHAYFAVNGTILLEICNNRGELVGFTGRYLDVPPNQPFNSSLELVTDPFKVTENGLVRIYFQNIQIREKEWSLSD